MKEAKAVFLPGISTLGSSGPIEKLKGGGGGGGGLHKTQLSKQITFTEV